MKIKYTGNKSTWTYTTPKGGCRETFKSGFARWPLYVDTRDTRVRPTQLLHREQHKSSRTYM